MNFKNIHIGEMIKLEANNQRLEISRICKFFDCSMNDVEEMYQSKVLNTGIVLKWSKLLEYDFFRVFSHHLILYAPQSGKKKTEKKKTSLPQFRKNIYTNEIIEFILERIHNEEMTRLQVVEQYKIPKTTLYKWIDKYKNNENK